MVKFNRVLRESCCVVVTICHIFKVNTGLKRVKRNLKSKKESTSQVIARLVSVDGLTFNQIANSSLISRTFKADGYSMPKSPQTIRNHFVKEFKKLTQPRRTEIVFQLALTNQPQSEIVDT